MRHNTMNSADRFQSLKISRLCKSEIDNDSITNYNNIIYDTIIRQINSSVDDVCRFFDYACTHTIYNKIYTIPM